MAYVKTKTLNVLVRAVGLDGNVGLRRVEVELHVDHYIGVDTCGEPGCGRILAWYDSGGEGARDGFRADGATGCDHDDTLFCKEHRVNRKCPDCSSDE